MIAELLRLTFGDARAAARWIMALDLPDSGVWLAYATVVVMGLAATVLSLAMIPVDPAIADANPVMYLAGHPYVAALFQGGFLVVLAAGIAFVGRRFGGIARFRDGLLLVSWMEFVMICIQAVQLVLVLILPPVAMLTGIAAFALFFWLLTAFTAEANGFRSLPVVFLGIIVCLFAAALLSGVAMVSLGLMPLPQPEV